MKVMYSGKELQEYVQTIGEWLDARGEVGMVIVDFADTAGSRATTSIYDPGGPRWVQYWKQDKEILEIFHYQRLNLNEDEWDVVIIGEEDEEEEPVVEESIPEPDFFERLEYGKCAGCGEYHVPKEMVDAED